MPDDPGLEITIDSDECIGDGACADAASETFEMDDEDKAFVKEPIGDDRDTIIAAAEECPTDCITIVDSQTGEKLCPKD